MADIITSDTKIKITAASHPAHYRLGQLAIKAAFLGLALRMGSGIAFALVITGCVIGALGGSALIVMPLLIIGGITSPVLLGSAASQRKRARAYGRQLLALPKPE